MTTTKRAPKTNHVSFAVTSAEAKTIKRIVTRAAAELFAIADDVEARLSLEMDITATHANGCPLELELLLDGDSLHFAHDIYGIRRHIDRRTGKLGGFFLPRFARKEA